MTKTSSSLIRVASSLFFLSGFAALIYEVIWFKRFTHVWGSSTLSQMVVVTTFLFGLALGAYGLGKIADRVRSPLAWYSVCEMAIGLLALAVPYEIHLLRGYASSIYSALQDYPSLQFMVRFGLTALVIGPPCVLMGGTLPLLMKHFLIVQPWNRETTGWLYAVNTLGAAFGAFFAGFYFLPGLGMNGANWLAVILDFYIALLVYLLLRQIPNENSEPVPEKVEEENSLPNLEPDIALTFTAKTIYLASAITGCASLILQMVWTRNLAVMLGGTTYAFSSMLFVFLLGIGLGSLVYSRWIHCLRNLAWILSGTILLLVVSTMMGRLAIPYLSMAVGFLRGLRSDPLLNGLISIGVNAVIQFVPTLCMGFLFPLFVDLLRWKNRNVGAVVGNLYSWNTVGCILGASLTPIALIAVWGTAMTTAVALGLYGLSLWWVFPSKRIVARMGLAVALGVILLSGWITSIPDDPRFTNMGQFMYGYLPHQDVQKDFTVLYFKESISSNVMVLETASNRHLRVNGKVDAGDTGDMPMQMGLAYFPRLFRPQVKNVLVIGFGSGTTAGCSLMFPQTRVTCCEIEPAVVEAGDFFTHVNHEPLRSRNFHLVLDDGRSYLEGCQEQFDLILSEPSNPWMAGISNLFTTEFYQHARSHLNPQGIFTQWIHTYNFTTADYAMVARTLLHVFPHCVLVRISVSDTLILASDAPLNPTLDDIRAAQKMVDESPVVSEDLSMIFETKDVATLLLKYWMLPEESIRKFVETDDEPVLNTDITLRLEYSAPLQLFVPRDQQENVDRELIRTSRPEWWITKFQEWESTADRASALKTWIRRFLENDYRDSCKPLLDFTLNLIPDDPYLLGENLYYHLDDKEWFDQNLDRLVSLSADEAYRIGMVIREKQKFDQAAQILDKVVKQRPSWATAWTNLALCYADLNLWDLADAKFTQAQLADPNNPFLIDAYQKYRRSRGSIEFFEE